ncbi:putative n-sulfoglucosamine sulfohydrolase [Diplodia seriata]|uniref:Putative n-sulfoglucosamine sulfohydrolase n=1 Tax=Diplodia seriata TaxID=420778 RepID=A0A0G2EHT1_9PEZI|nr:putative n-sulfoglucosamine sulfohydrolase [Diplodia seriata]
MGQQKNIVLLVADDLGRDQMGCYGCKAIRTPHLDALSASGTRFDLAFTSTASCSGSRTVIYTGLHTHETGSYGLNLERNGFQTFANVETAPEAFNRIGYKTGILGKIHVSPDDKYPWQVREESGSRNVAYIADRASAFLREAQDEKVRQELAEYYRAIMRMDQGVGLILDALDAAGQKDDTLVLFLSDNGPPFINSKTTLFEAGVRLPFLLRAPGISAPGSVNPNLVSYVDILPTFLDWAGHGGANAPQGRIQRRGRSILGVLAKESPDEAWSHVFGSHTFHEITNYWPTRFMRNRRFKYHRNVCWKLDFPMAMDLYASLSFEGMRNASPPMIGKRKFKDYIQRPAEELYDLEQDPLELENLSGRSEFQGTLGEMRKALEEWQMATKDLWLWRDGTAVVRYTGSHYNYSREGLRIPDRFDLDVENPGTQDVKATGNTK